MKRPIIIFLVIVLSLAGCSTQTEEPAAENVPIYTNSIDYDSQAISQTFADWVMGTEYGIDEIKIDEGSADIIVVISDDNYSKLEDYEIADISTGIKDILAFYNLDSSFSIKFSNGQGLEEAINNVSESNAPSEQSEDAASETPYVILEEETVNLIFIHHSVGENWLNAGLNEMLNDNNIHVADTYYGWREMGDRTDTSDWPDWFNDDVMPTVYSEMGNMTGYNNIAPAEGENTIIMFKSCFPNSDVGNSIEDEKEIYLSLLGYFEKHPDKMFVLITPPPMQSISHPDKTRELTNWLVSMDGWRKDYKGNNLFVFDFYNVLTAEENHHMLVDGKEAHIVDSSSNTLYYDSGGDDHPNDEGSQKAAQEFVPLLIYWYGEFIKNQ